VKLANKDDKGFTFLVGKKERELMISLLRRYPVIIGAHFKDRPKRKKPTKNEELLQEALDEQQKENRTQLEEMLAESGRFEEDELGFRFHLKAEEMEWLLQIFNDVRVGSWIQLGEPEVESGFAILEQRLDEQTVQMAWTMEMAGLFEHELLEAFGT
jgi:hypothetical protein